MITHICCYYYVNCSCAVYCGSEQEQDKAQEQLRRERELRRKKEEEDSLTLEQTKEQVHCDELFLHMSCLQFLFQSAVHNFVWNPNFLK